MKQNCNNFYASSRMFMQMSNLAKKSSILYIVKSGKSVTGTYIVKSGKESHQMRHCQIWVPIPTWGMFRAQAQHAYTRPRADPPSCKLQAASWARTSQLERSWKLDV